MRVDGVPTVSQLVPAWARVAVAALWMATALSACARPGAAPRVVVSGQPKGQESPGTAASVSPPGAPACTESDLDRPGPAVMPTAVRLGAVETFPTATVTLRPPLPDDVPVVSPQQAWDNAWTDKRSDASYEVLLARMTATFPASMGPGTSSTPLYDGVLVWAVVSHRIPFVPAGGPPPSPGQATTPGPPCFWADQLDLTDATTGQRMFSTTFGTGT